MFFIDPKVKPQFDTLSVDLRNVISEKDVQIKSLTDLIRVLEDISSDTQS